MLSNQPIDDHAVPSHRAMLVTPNEPRLANAPPITRWPLGRMASALGLTICTVSADHVVPSHWPMKWPGTPGTTSPPPTNSVPSARDARHVTKLSTERPGPTADHVPPFQRARWLIGTPPQLQNVPPTSRSPFGANA